MKFPFYLSFVILLSLTAQDSPSAAIISPAANDALRGEAAIVGSTDMPDFASAQLDFAYAANNADTWFPLATFSLPARETTLYLWDTTSIADGGYTLRLRVFLTDGSLQEATVPITIQNDTPIPSPTPVFTAAPSPFADAQIPTPFFLAASPTPTEVPHPTPTPLPPNPISLTQNAILSSFGRGALVILGLFILAFIFLRLRNN
ncbi:MAG: hypothetical protein OZ914_06140 [Anaerolineaceae bacterium]|jgi:hypothetical protein|nr:hypothetical protein [Anaerolineaceae bacterium]OQY90680.1 MAG: hypothetical protein B6D38_02820 [Anaerolineae bacterium UTCFX1]